MVGELVEVELHPIPKFDVSTTEGKIRLQKTITKKRKTTEKLIAQGKDHDYFSIQIEKKTLESGRVPFYYLTPVPIDTNERQNNRLRVYKIVFQEEKVINGKKLIVVYGQIEKAVNL